VNHCTYIFPFAFSPQFFLCLFETGKYTSDILVNVNFLKGDIDRHLRHLKEMDREKEHSWTKWESGNHNFAHVVSF